MYVYDEIYRVGIVRLFILPKKVSLDEEEEQGIVTIVSTVRESDEGSEGTE